VNYISSFNDDSFALLGANVIGGTNTAPQFDRYRRVSDYITLDAQLSYEFMKQEAPLAAAVDNSKGAESVATIIASNSWYQQLLSGTRLTIGVNNAFDRNPPTVLGAFNDNYDTSLYSIRNRYWYVAFNKKF